ncbi:MAG TPA: Rne/Rng family ribonuclease [Terriglobales bacterium]|jgi:ribonuclease G
MSKELVIGSNRHETRAAILEDDQLVEVYFQRGNEYSLAGSIHKGRVTRVLPGMQSAFVDLGLERDTFLYVSDFFEENEDIEAIDEKPSRGERRDRGHSRAVERASIEVIPAPSQAPVEPVQPENGGGNSGGVAAEPLPNGDVGNGQLAGGDRGGRGERRGRRSRRRRQRGRGFPENKYVQPASAAQAPEPSEEGENEEADVIVLPGESLAKYRHAGPGQELEGASSASSETPRGELEAEAQEIELTDKVFAHREEDETGGEETADEEDTASAKPLDFPQSAPEEDTVSNLVPIRDESSVPPANGGGVSPQHESQFSGSVPEEEGTEDEAELAVAEEGIPEVDDTILDNALPIADPGTGATAGDEVPVAQTASMREQGGRYMHRVSRRMRRRRGGNRFQQQKTEIGFESAGGGTAAATALEPEAHSSESQREGAEEHSTESPDRVLPSIADLLKPGQEIIVQIAKEPLGQKGARITSHIALPGRYVVFMPSVSHLGVSRKVSSEEERQRLKRILQTHRVGTTGGFIVRTAGEGVPDEEIAADMNFLYSLWLDIRQKAEKRPAPALLHHDLDIVQRILRDQVTSEFKAIWVDNEEMYESVLTFMQRFQPALVNRVKMYTRPAPIFDAFNITQELEKALRPKVWLKSGGYIVINQTEALVAIDINTGKYVGKSNRLEDTIVKTNIEAVREIVRQIRLRDLGGIIVVDFIDMDERKNRQKVMQALEEAMRADKAPYKILQFNDFGLVAITRKRVKQSLERTLCAPCPYCDGAGYVKSVQTIISEILVEAQKIAKAIEGKDVVLRVHPDVAKVLKSSDNQYLEELEEILHRPVLVTGDLTLHHEKFDLV